MAEKKEVRLPDIGETEGVTVIEVLVAPGAEVAVEDSLITLESDKASMDVPSPVAGKIVEIKVAAGDGVSEDMVIAVIEVAEGAAKEPEPVEKPEPEPVEQPEPEPEKQPEPEPAKQPEPEEEPKDDRTREDRIGEDNEAGESPRLGENVDEASFARAYASPAVRRYARELGVDLGRVRGSGRRGRILREDVQTYVKVALESRGGAAPAAGGLALPEMPEIDFSKFGPVEEKKLHRIKKLTAKNVHRSWLHVPHVTQHEEADVTELERFRQAEKKEAEKRGVKLTPVAFLLKAVAAALREFPDFNSSLSRDGESLIVKGYYNIGVAVDTPEGLVVPVIRDVDQKGLYQLAGELIETSGRAREGKPKPQDFQGGTFTVSSLGGIGGTAFTPIVNAPEVAILGVSRNEMKPVWNGETFEPRLMMPLSLSYDHRVIDGAQAARFIVHLAGLLGDLRRLLL